MRLLGLERLDDLSCRDETDDRNAGCFNRLSSTFFPVRICKYACYESIRGTDGLDCAQRRSAGGDHIFYHGYPIAFSEWSLDGLSRSVRFCLFPHGEGSQRTIGISAGVTDGIGDRVGAEREAADRIYVPARLPQSGETKRADKRQALWAHRRQSCIDIIFRLLAGSECKLTAFGGTFGKKCDERRVISHGAGGYGFL